MSDYLLLLFLISLSPLAAFILIWLLPKEKRTSSPFIGVLGCFVSWIANLLLAFLIAPAIRFPMDDPNAQLDIFSFKFPLLYEISWLPLEQVHLSVGFFVDQLNLVTLLVVTTISFFVQLFSVAYMHDDPSRPRYFSFLSFFVFAMINLVLSSNLLQTYFFWELVGLASYLLIGFWFEKEAPAKAARKAFVTTRFGDLGFYLAILLLLITFGSTSFADLNSHQVSQKFAGFEWLITTIALLIFGGVAGKSAQAPLHAWLPDAMEGPTPVSALIHSATMVAAGVFLVARLYPFYSLSPTAMTVILGVASLTALGAATLATVQNDIKRILAYSTISQLGLMMMGLAAGTYAGGLFHLVTHAMFKSLLFLTAGALIHHYHTNDIWEMAQQGARKQIIPIFALLIGAFSLAGVIPFAGFWSKDVILEQLHTLHLFWYGVGLAVSCFTAYYTFRLLLVLLRLPLQSEAAHSPKSHAGVLVSFCLAIPLIALAIGSFFVGLAGTPYGGYRLLLAIDPHTHGHWNPEMMVVSSVVVAVGILFAIKNYWRPAAKHPQNVHPNPVRNILEKKYFADHLYENVVGRGTMAIAAFCHWFDRTLINGVMVNGAAANTYRLGTILSRVQSGMFQDYLFWGLLISVIAVWWIVR